MGNSRACISPLARHAGVCGVSRQWSQREKRSRCREEEADDGVRAFVRACMRGACVLDVRCASQKDKRGEREGQGRPARPSVGLGRLSVTSTKQVEKGTRGVWCARQALVCGVFLTPWMCARVRSVALNNGRHHRAMRTLLAELSIPQRTSKRALGKECREKRACASTACFGSVVYCTVQYSTVGHRSRPTPLSASPPARQAGTKRPAGRACASFACLRSGDLLLLVSTTDMREPSRCIVTRRLSPLLSAATASV